MLNTNELIQQVCKRLHTMQSRQKIYADRCRFDIEFWVRDFVLINVSPWKSAIYFRKRGKLRHKFIRPFRVFERT